MYLVANSSGNGNPQAGHREIRFKSSISAEKVPLFVMTSDTSDPLASGSTAETIVATASDKALLQQGAEGKLYLDTFDGQPCLVKERFVKAYRHPQLDQQLTRERMRAETRAIARCEAVGITVPKVFLCDLKTRRIHMQYFPHCCTVKQFVQNVLPASSSSSSASSLADQRLIELATRIGAVLGTMHAHNIIHGDLTTSNMLLTPKSPTESEVTAASDYELVMIDFGLSHYDVSAEDKGVDLYVLERALLSTHNAVMPRMFDDVLAAYRGSNAAGCRDVISKLDEVRARGRKRTMVG